MTSNWTRLRLLGASSLLLPLLLTACGSSKTKTADTTVAAAASETTAAAASETTAAAGTETTAAGATETTAAGAASAPAAEGCPPADGSAAKKQQFTSAPPMCIDAAKSYTAVMDTDKGSMTFELLPAKAPKTVNNFVVLARYHYFDGITFHRVVPNFVLQGGDPEGTGRGGPGYTFVDELPQAGEYKVGSLAMANAGPDTNGSQFFIISGSDGTQLPPQYSLFGQLTDGQATVDAIAALAQGDGPPKEPVTIKSVTISEK